MAAPRRPANGRASAGRTGPGVSEAANVPIEFGPAEQVGLAAGAAARALVADPLGRPHLPDGLPRHRAHDDRDRSRRKGSILWERQAPDADDEDRGQAEQPGIAEPGGRGEWRVRVLPGLRADRVRDRRPRALEDAARPVQQHLRHGRVTGHRRQRRRARVRSEHRARSSWPSTSARARSDGRRRGPEAKSGHATPIVWRAPDGRDQILLPGSFLLTAYDVATGAKRWWVRGLSFEIKSTPVVAGDTIFINGYGAPQNDPGRKVDVPPAGEGLEDGRCRRQRRAVESRVPQGQSQLVFDGRTSTATRSLSQDEWEYYRAALDSENGMLAIRLGGHRRHDRDGREVEVPALGAAAAVAARLSQRALHGERQRHRHDAEPGDRRADQRRAASPARWAPTTRRRSPPSGHIFFVSERGAVAVLPPTGELTPVVVNDLKEDTYATPAFADGRIYIRTVEALVRVRDK